MPSDASHPCAAYIEDYNEDAKTTIPESRQTANIAAKRSRPEFTKLKVRDEASDSGYFANTSQPPENGDPSKISKSATVPLKVDTAVATTKRKPVGPEKRLESKSRSPEKKPVRNGSTKAASKAREKEALPPGNCQCQECIALARRSTAPVETSRPMDYYLPNQPSRSPYEVPPSPQSARPSFGRPTVPHTTQVRPQPTPPLSHRPPRPMSFHAGAMPEPLYLQPIYLERRPPQMYEPQPSFPPPSYPQNIPYLPPLQAAPQRQDGQPPPISPYEAPIRPQSRQWASEYHTPSRRSRIYSTPPIVEYAPQSAYTTVIPSSYPTNRQMSSHHDRPYRVGEGHASRDEDYYLMPPPGRIPSSTSKQQHQLRPTIRHAATTSDAHPPLHHRRSDRSGEIADGTRSQPSSRKPSEGEQEIRIKRPPLATIPSSGGSNDKQAKTQASSRNDGHIKTESSGLTAKQKRRVSYHGHETPNELERVVEAYQASKNVAAPAVPIPLTADSLKLVRKKTHNSSSDTGSRRSGGKAGSREGSEVKTRSAIERRGASEVKGRTDNDDDGITMRFNTSQGVKVDLKGSSVEGRTISLRPSQDGDGEMELSIGGREKASGNRDEVRERSKRYSFFGAKGTKEPDPSRGTSRMGRVVKEIEDNREKERRTVGSMSRRSSRSGYSGRGLVER